MLGEDEQKRNDAIDFLIDGMQDIIKVEQPDGSYKLETRFNPEIAWYKGHMINQPFGRCALYIKRLEHVAELAENFMFSGRALILKKGIMLIVEEYKRSIDAKSSETWRDKNNSQSALIHLLSRNKTERQITLKEDAKRSILDDWLGKDKNKEEE